MKPTRMIFETVSEELRRMYSALVILEMGISLDLPRVYAKLTQSEEALSELSNQLEGIRNDEIRI